MKITPTKFITVASLVGLFLVRPASGADVIYLQNFGETTNNISVSTFNTDTYNNTLNVSGSAAATQYKNWNVYFAANLSSAVAETTAGYNLVLANASGDPANPANVSAAAGVSTSLTKGFLYTNGACDFLAFTNVSISLSAYSDLTFSWLAGDNVATDKEFAAIKIGSDWYVSDFVTPPNIGSGGNFPTQAVKKTIDLDLTHWYQLTATIGSAFNIASTATTLPSGDISAFGVFGESNGTMRIDTYSITGMENIPEPSTWIMLLGGVGMLGFFQRARMRKP